MAAGKEKYPFDTETLIEIIKQKPVLWDPSLQDYKIHDARKRAWEDVAEMCMIQQDFRSLEKFEQQEAIRLIQQRWKTARDAFRRDLLKIKSGRAVKQTKKYIYFENLKFLDKSLDFNQTGTNLDMEHDNTKNSYEHKDFTHFLAKEETLEEEVLPHENIEATRKRMQNQYIDETPKEFLEIQSCPDNNGHRAFLTSLLPILNNFDEDKTLRFRAEVLRVMMDIKREPNQNNI